MIEPVQVVNFSETYDSRRSLIVEKNLLLDGDYIYAIFHLGYTGDPSVLVKFNTSDFTYDALNLGSGFTATAPIVNFDKNYIVFAIVLSNYRTIRFFVVDKNTLQIVRTFNIQHSFPVGDFSSMRELYKRSDGGLTVCIYCKNHQAYAVRNNYVINLNPMDILNDSPSIMNSFHLGVVDLLNRDSDGMIFYHPSQRNANINRNNFRFMLHTDDDTLQTMYYGDGTPAPVPFRPDNADYSKVNSYLSGFLKSRVDTKVGDKYVVTGNDLNRYAAFEIYDTNFNALNHYISSITGSMYNIGSDEYVLIQDDTNRRLMLMKIDTLQTEYLEGTYTPGGAFIAYTHDENYFYLFDTGESKHQGRVSIFNIRDIHIFIPSPPRKMYPFWFGR